MKTLQRTPTVDELLVKAQLKAVKAVEDLLLSAENACALDVQRTLSTNVQMSSALETAQM